jgi:magnesium chelatase subunit D
MDLEKLEESLKKHQESLKHRTHTPTGPGSDKDAAQRASRDPGMKEVVFAPAATFPVKPLDLPPDRIPKKALGRRTQAPTEDKSGRYVRSTPSPRGAPDLALDATLRAAAPYQAFRDKGNLALAVAPPDVRHKVREKRIGHHILFVVDASGSMGARERMAETKAAILSLLLDAYQKRERVGLITFRGRNAELALPFTNSVETARKCLEHLPTGGKTPLPHALSLAFETINQEKLKHPKDAFLLVLITDGKANISLTGAPAMVETKKLAAKLRSLNINTLVLDTEVHTPMIDFGCLPELSKILGGRYIDIEDLRAPELVARIAELRQG